MTDSFGFAHPERIAGFGRVRLAPADWWAKGHPTRLSFLDVDLQKRIQHFVNGATMRQKRL